MNSAVELEAIFQNDENMDVLMDTGFTSSISMEKKATIARYNSGHAVSKMFLLSF